MLKYSSSITKMAKKKKEGKILNDAKEHPVDKILKTDEDWQVKSLAAESETKLEDDKGYGQAVTLRHFYFKPNPETFKVKQPTSQELFNAHYKQIEIELWKDGWSVFADVSPRVRFAKDKSHYVIIVGALPARGHIPSTSLRPKTLTEIIHENRIPS